MMAPMYDVGKIVVPDDILKKPGRVTEEDGLLVLRYTGPEGHTETARVYVRSGAGGASLAGAQTTAEGIKL